MADIQQMAPVMSDADREVARTLRREKVSRVVRYVVLIFVGLADALPAGVDVLRLVQAEP